MTNKKLTKIDDKQLGLFAPFFANSDDERQKLSNLIEFWDRIPRYSISRQAMSRMRDSNGNLPLLEVEFRYGKESFSATISPALVKEKKINKDTKQVEYVQTSYYPSANEELIEEVLRKLAADQFQGTYDKESQSAGVNFTLYQIREELRATGHTRSFDEIKLSLDILSSSVITFKGEGMLRGAGLHVMARKSSYLTDFISVERKDLDIDPNLKWSTKFHPLVSRSINALAYRQFNYGSLMSLKQQLARWIYRYLLDNYTFANHINSFEMRFSTIKRDSNILNYYKRDRDSQDICQSSIEELKSNGVLREYTSQNELGNKGKIIDIVYTFMPSEDFIDDQKRANARKKQAELAIFKFKQKSEQKHLG